MGMSKIISSKTFLIVVSLIVGGVIGWFSWYLVYPNLHVSGSEVWTGSVAPSTGGKAPTTGYSSGSSSINTKSGSSSYSPTASVPSAPKSSSSSNGYSY